MVYGGIHQVGLKALFAVSYQHAPLDSRLSTHDGKVLSETMPSKKTRYSTYLITLLYSPLSALANQY